MTDASPSPSRPGTFVVSLDFELHWGVRDVLTVEQYRANLLGVRSAVPAMLELFQRYAIHATWATVGLLFFETREEMLRALPQVLPQYRDRKLSPYEDLADIGADEASDPFHFAPSLIELIARTPHQEIATHTFSHYYCLEEGHSAEAFREDLECAQRAAGRRGIQLRSIVFPRNQADAECLEICRQMGILAYRGNESHWMYRASRDSHRSWLRRGLRLLDAYCNISSNNCHEVLGKAPVNVPSSRFLRPYSRRLKCMERLRLRRITTAMTQAAQHGLLFHLWWHPHNFGVDLERNLGFLQQILEHFSGLQRQHAMESLTMHEVSRRALALSDEAHEREQKYSVAGRAGPVHQHRL